MVYEADRVVLKIPFDNCPADFDASGSVGFTDLLAVLTDWGAAGGPLDLDGNGSVGFGDLLIVLSAWGACPTA